MNNPETESQENTAAVTFNPNDCDENHCFCNQFDEYGDILCAMENTAAPWKVMPPAKNMSIEGILARLTAALDEQARQIEIIKSLL